MKSVDDEATEMAMMKILGDEEDSEGESFDPEEDDLAREELGELSPEEADIIRMIRTMKSQTV